ncbi:transglycosylase SLT domain protein [Bacteriovorax sp. BSW11_IV]|nr:transglycosylase SLT domain protein [Bacteriovorax sp. BSW11_IV]
MYSLGEFDVAKQYLDSKRREWKESKLRVASLPLYKKIGHYDAMISQVYSLSQESRRELIEENPTYAFPTPYKEEVKAAAKKFNVEPELIYAISRQESAFNQHARSWADAFGVMQIIPEKAKILGQRYQIPYRDHDDLFTPQTNVLLGASLLNELNKMFDGIFPLYVASYNASDSAVRKWYKERYSGDLIEFIEMIPYAETRKYVKLVMRNFFIYKKINSSESIEFTTNFFTSQLN